jgi:hypothetical protein
MTWERIEGRAISSWNLDQLIPIPASEFKISNIINNVDIQHRRLATSDSDSPATHLLMASQLVPLFHCPVCPSPSPLVAPVTLFCGHTVCARHVLLSPSPPSSPRLLRLSPCPLSSCTVSPSDPATLPNIPSSSRVTIYPAADVQLDRDAAAFATIPQSRTDVTINKLASIVQRHHRLSRSTLTGSGSDTDTDDEEISDTNTIRPSPSQPGASTPGSTSIVPSDASSSSSISTQIASSLDASLQHQAPARSNARKRRRKHLPPPRRLDSPAQSTDFENELLAELSCEICFMLLYQPITSPCQHVRTLLSRFFLIPLFSNPFILARPYVRGVYTAP